MRIFGSFIALLFSVSAAAQGVFIAPMVELSEMNKLIHLGYGIGGGIQVNRWVVGAYGMQLPVTTGDERELELTLGGGWLAYQQPASEALTVNVGIKAALGNVQQQFDASAEEDRIWLITPEAGVELALGRRVRLSYAVGYRIAGDLQLSRLQNQDLYTLVNTLIIKIGRFEK